MSGLDERIGALTHTDAGTPVFKDMKNGVLDEATKAYKESHNAVKSAFGSLVEASTKAKGDLGKAAKALKKELKSGKVTSVETKEAFEAALKSESAEAVKDEVKALNDAKAAKATAREAFASEVQDVRTRRAEVLKEASEPLRDKASKAEKTAEGMSKKAEAAGKTATEQGDVAKGFKEAGEKFKGGADKRGFFTRTLFNETGTKGRIDGFKQGVDGFKGTWKNTTGAGKTAMIGAGLTTAYLGAKALGMFSSKDQQAINGGQQAYGK